MQNKVTNDHKQLQTSVGWESRVYSDHGKLLDRKAKMQVTTNSNGQVSDGKAQLTVTTEMYYTAKQSYQKHEKIQRRVREESIVNSDQKKP